MRHAKARKEIYARGEFSEPHADQEIQAMISNYKIEADQLVPAGKDDAHILFYFAPTPEERKQLIDEFRIDPVNMDAINDPDEVPRIESNHESVLIIWKLPDNVSIGDTIEFQVSSLGLVLCKGKAIVIIPHGEIQLSAREFKRVTSPEEFALRVLLHTIHHYQGHLKAIKMMSADLEAKIVTSMENKYLLQMFTLGESLVYYYNALESNVTILSRLRGAADKLKFNAEQISLLDDIIIENQQAAKQASIYSTVLSGLMDARGSIINNNMNVLLKNLTIINVVFLPLNLIAGILGMSEYSMMAAGMDWRISYFVFSLAMILIGWLTWRWLMRVVDRKAGVKRRKI